MALLEELKPGIHIKGLLPGKLVTLIEVKPYGATVSEVTYKDASGLPGTTLLYQNDAARLEASVSGNAFHEMPLCIARLDKLSRDERARALLEQTAWDLVVVDEAHKMSATTFGSDIKRTKRYQLGQLLGRVTRHLLLLT